MSRTADRLHPYCRACKSAYNKRHYRENKARYIALVTAKKQERLPLNRRRMGSYFLAHPCVDCGERDPVVLELDHVDPATKTTEVCRMLADYTWRRIEQEIAKCEVRCANCHRRKTAHALGWYTTKMEPLRPGSSDG